MEVDLGGKSKKDFTKLFKGSKDEKELARELEAREKRREEDSFGLTEEDYQQCCSTTVAVAK